MKVVPLEQGMNVHTPVEREDTPTNCNVQSTTTRDAFDSGVNRTETLRTSTGLKSFVHLTQNLCYNNFCSFILNVEIRRTVSIISPDQKCSANFEFENKS